MNTDKQKIDRVRLENYTEQHETGKVDSWNKAAENCANAADSLEVRYSKRDK